MPTVDFAAIKASVTLEQTVAKLGISMKQEGEQLRGSCPACSTNGKRDLSIRLREKDWRCWVSMERSSRSVIDLVAHVRRMDTYHAAAFLGTPHPPLKTPKSLTEVVARMDAKMAAPALPQETENPLAKVAARLEFDHPQVQALGLSPDRARALGIGFDAKGMMRGRVLWPLYDQGQLVGFMGLDDKGGVKLPPNLTNVVPLRKTGT